MSVATASHNASAVRQDSSPFNDELRVLGLAHALDAYLPKPMVVVVGTRRGESRQRLASRIRKHYPDLSEDVCAKIASRGSFSLKRVSNCIEAINDNLITSSPEVIRSLQDSPEYKKLIHWAYSLAAHSSDRVTREWKKFSALVKWCALASETDAPPYPQDFPGYAASWAKPTVLPPFWCKLVPWLSAVMERGVQNKVEATRVMHFTTSRNFPAGGKQTREESLRKHSVTLHSRHSLSEPRKKILERLSYLIGKQTKRHMDEQGYTSLGHTSLTANASLDSSTDMGGRAAEVGMKFRSWLDHIPDQDVLETTWFNQSYWLKAGRPRWQTMCRDSLNHELSHEAGESDDRVDLDFENFKLEDPLYGLDDRTGYQLLQWSIEEGLNQGILEGSPFARENDKLRLSGTCPSIRPSAIGEPGAKSRVVTVGEDWLTMLLQPWSHHVIGGLRTHPSATSGLTRGWQLFEWVKRQGNSAPPPAGDRYFLSSDLTTATDFCTHEYSLAMLRGLHRGLERASDPYFDLCATLLCSGRIYESDIVEENFDVATTRGILMGDPGAKIVLTMHNLCAEVEAFLRHVYQMIDATDEEFLFRLSTLKGIPVERWRLFACSGDDHFGQGPRSYLQRITLNHALNGMSVSWPQNFLSSRGGFYCEEMLLTVGLADAQIWGRKVPLRDVPYQDQPHIDAMKIRLLSTCAKEHEGKDEPNPAIGKARQMHGMLAWLGGGWESLTPLISRRWEQRMKAFLPSSLALRYLPVKLGGIEAPAYHRPKVDVRTALRSLPEHHLWAIKQVLDGTATPMLSRVLASFATNARARGISADMIEDQIRETLLQADLVRGVDDSGLRNLALERGLLPKGEDVDLVWRNLRYKDKAAYAKRMRLVDVHEAISLIGRPYLFRDMLYPEVSRRHGIDPYRSKQYENVPWAARQDMFYKNLLWNMPTSQTTLSSEETDTLVGKIADWCVENKPLDIPKEVYFFPEAVVAHEKLATLRTRL
uniref:RNA-dependent RNA polymerase n=1 Tax=Botryosphaeria dothidea narnavirus 3 TaxID=2785367 RepID=A0A7T4X3R8_9VIRU|nr:RNA-dependent RNA polymerase [Botryosphaeria dothidea narnavirus 3]